MLWALLLQTASVILLRHQLGKTWLRRPVTILVLVSVVYQGVSLLLLSFPAIGAQDTYRDGLAAAFTDEAALVLSAAMLAFTVAYLTAKPGRVSAEGAPAALPRALDWRLLAVCCLPLAILTYEGRGYNGSVTTQPTAPLSSNLAAGFFVILIALAAFSFVHCYGVRWFLPALAAQSLLLGAAGERTPVIADAIVLTVLLAHGGMHPSRRQVGAAVLLTLGVTLVLTSVRAEQGRAIYASDSGLGARVSGLASGVTSRALTAGGSLVSQGAMRLDGTSFAAAILQSENQGQPSLSPAGIPESLLIAVPSALWPAKISHEEYLNPAAAETDGFGLQQVNFLPGLPGMYAGFVKPFWLIALLAILGLVCGHAERFLLRRRPPTQIVLLAASVSAALTYEAGLPAMLVIIRNGIALALVVRLLSAVLPTRAAAARHPAQSELGQVSAQISSHG